MNKLWPVVTKEHPCPICGKPDFCCLGDRAIKCMREPSEHPSKDGGWYHPFGHRVHSFTLPKRNVAPPLKDAGLIWGSWWVKTSTESRVALAGKINISVISLCNLGVCYSFEHRAWAFPMCDFKCNIIGIRLRDERGNKWAVSGSRQGLFIPITQEVQKTLYIVEGPTDTCAGLDLGLYVIGRPSCNAGGELIKDYIRANKVSRVVIVADNDETLIKGVARSPGVEGANRLGKELGKPYVVYIPPAKDLREFLKLGGTRELIESSIKNLIWK